MRHLEVLQNQGLIRIFTHEALPPGTLWHEATQFEISKAAAAILLVTPDYLASRALVEDQLPLLLARAEDQGKKRFAADAPWATTSSPARRATRRSARPGHPRYLCC